MQYKRRITDQQHSDPYWGTELLLAAQISPAEPLPPARPSVRPSAGMLHMDPTAGRAPARAGQERRASLTQAGHWNL